MYPPNQTKRKLRSGEFVFGMSISDVRGITLPDLFADLGFDFLFFDMEHSPDGFETLCDMMWTSRKAGITPIPRVQEAFRPCISRTLDAGAQGVIVPRVETVEQVDQVVSFCRYPPLGTRGVALGGRHVDYQNHADHRTLMDQANEEVMVAIQIETPLALESVDDLVSRPGVDLIFIGPQDLSVAVGVPSQYESPQLDSAIGRIIEASHRVGLPVGIQGRDVKLAKRWIEMGVRLVVLGTVMQLIRQSAREGLSRIREVTNELTGKEQSYAK